jgi:uncharacterized small protein (DUF1192 family)
MSDLELTMMRRVGELNKENARLKAEVEELTGLLKASTYYNTSDEVTRLKAEVEELKSQPDPLTAYLYAAELGKDDRKTLKDEVKRLTAALAEALNERNKAEAQVKRLTTWQPIETAPSHQEVLCWIYNYNSIVVGHQAVSFQWEDAFSNSTIYPTHWMPLPIAPIDDCSQS